MVFRNAEHRAFVVETYIENSNSVTQTLNVCFETDSTMWYCSGLNNYSIMS